MPVAALIAGLFALISDDDRMNELERRQSDLGLSDAQLWSYVESPRSPLAGMTWRDALLYDPRRIDVMMYKAVFSAIDSVVQLPAQAKEMNRALYLQAMDLARQVSGDPISLEVLVSLARDNWGLSLHMLEQAPPDAKRYLAGFIGRLEDGFQDAVDIAQNAADDMRSIDPDQGMLWLELAEVYAESWEAYKAVILGSLLPGGDGGGPGLIRG